MIMKKGIIYPTSRISVDLTKDGESIEEQMRKAMRSGEPINATAKLEYSNRGDGVLPQFDIRSDRFEYARMATDKVHASNYAIRMESDGYIKDEGGNWSKPTVTESNQQAETAQN